ncbi:acyltransferase family protein [Rhizobium sp. AAP43]|uniref:acyltransferase family protein n=1 Tax=Rhizobium sp. AAP43 TaxID=1523420 RepID=UPI0018D1DF0F|nr:acyltransferase family protein [Rhizobium sp. AAP43]
MPVPLLFGEDGMATATGREHHWDGLRAFLMLLGIPYHAAMVYDMRTAWDVQSPVGSEALTLLSGFLVTFRMPAFFIVAGYFAALTLSRRPPQTWLRGRVIRLGIPFLTGLALLSPLQIALVDVADALRGITSMDGVAARTAFDVTHPGMHWIMHLWFLPALLAYSALLAALWTMMPRTASSLGLRPRLEAWVHRLGSGLLPLIVFLSIIWALFIDLSHLFLSTLDGPLPYLLAHGVDPYLRYLPFFLLGVLLRIVPSVAGALVWRAGWALPAAALLSAVIAAALRGRQGLEPVHAAADATAAVLMSFLLIGLALRLCRSGDARVDAVVDASFSIYLFHHPAIYGLASAFLLVAWPPIIEFLLIAAASLLLSFGLHRLIRKSSLALFLFNGARPKVASGEKPIFTTEDRSQGTLR